MAALDQPCQRDQRTAAPMAIRLEPQCRRDFEDQPVNQSRRLIIVSEGGRKRRSRPDTEIPGTTLGRYRYGRQEHKASHRSRPA
jgi:hypothetical protein